MEPVFQGVVVVPGRGETGPQGTGGCLLRVNHAAKIEGGQGAMAFLRAIVQAKLADGALMRLFMATVNISATRNS